MDAGVPSDVTAKSVRFRFNDVDDTRALFDTHGDDLACVVLEAATASTEPAPGYLEAVRELCDRHGVVLVFDEMITGFRWSEHGAQSVYGVTPDLSTWGKAMGNGFPIAALAGRRELMELGGLNTDADRCSCCRRRMARIRVAGCVPRVVAAYADGDPVGAMTDYGTALAAGVNALAADAGVAPHVRAFGRPAALLFGAADGDGAPSQAFRTLFMQELIDRGVLASRSCRRRHTPPRICVSPSTPSRVRSRSTAWPSSAALSTACCAADPSPRLSAAPRRPAP